MTAAPNPGRGRPVTFDQAAQDTYLTLIATGTRLGDAAAQCGIDRTTPHHLARRNTVFADRWRDAKTAGQARREKPKGPVHGRAGTYTNHACRCPPCTTAATQARANAPDRKPPPIRRLPAPHTSPAETELLMLADVS
ncbi:hypothetical protein [Streptomyces sp. NPDC017529]|uniref:hypothetical protein n=1 Tax=Streptomyces sp. NPDC017529 TaxID=3365000 RepID=UPI00378ECE3D